MTSPANPIWRPRWLPFRSITRIRFIVILEILLVYIARLFRLLNTLEQLLLRSDGYVRRSSPTFIQIHNLTPQSLLTVSNDLKEINIYTKLDKSPTADVDQNYNIMYQEIHKVINKYTTMRTVKFAKHKHKKLTGSHMAS